MDSTSALITVVIFLSWGLGSFLAKIAADKIGNQSVFWDVLGYTPAVVIFCLVFFKFQNLIIQFNENKEAALLACLAGAVGSLGAISFYYLLTRDEASKMVPLTALYPVVTVILAILFLKESVTFAKIAGVFFSLIAIYLLSI